MKRILIIYTGGTIGMIRTEKGYAPDSMQLRNALSHIDELTAPEMPQWEMLEMAPLLDSANMSVSEWNEIAKLISQHYEKYDGFVILHGTDTMAYTASALSFMLEGLDKPVILTGAQIPLCEVRSDGRNNIVSSVLIAGEGRVCEVALFFGDILLRGNRATKYSADGLRAFVSPNYPPLAETGISIRYNSHLFLQTNAQPFSICVLKNIAIGVIKIFPCIQPQIFETMIVKNLRAVVIEAFGTGNIPNNGRTLLPIVDRAKQNGTLLIVCSQCSRGVVSLGTYEASDGLKRAGAISAYDMTTEAAVAKLYYLFSLGYSNQQIKDLFMQNLRGELTAE